MAKLPLTYLFVPGDRPDRFDKALATSADAVVLDLEDAVTPGEKTRAREAVAQRLASARADDRARLVVRINDPSTPWYEADVQILHDRGAALAMLPKAEEAASVVHMRSACPDIDVLALIETVRGVLNAEALAITAGVQRPGVRHHRFRAGSGFVGRSGRLRLRRQSDCARILGAVQVAGRMVDRPVRLQAQRILARQTR